MAHVRINHVCQVCLANEVGYCALGTLLKYHEPIAYTRSRDYGWRNNIYILEARRSVAIVTGYAPFGNFHPYGLTKEYEAKAVEIENTCTAEEMNKLLIEYIDKVIEFRNSL